MGHRRAKGHHPRWVKQLHPPPNDRLPRADRSLAHTRPQPRARSSGMAAGVPESLAQAGRRGGRDRLERRRASGRRVRADCRSASLGRSRRRARRAGRVCAPRHLPLAHRERDDRDFGALGGRGRAACRRQCRAVRGTVGGAGRHSCSRLDRGRRVPARRRDGPRLEARDDRLPVRAGVDGHARTAAGAARHPGGDRRLLREALGPRVGPGRCGPLDGGGRSGERDPARRPATVLAGRPGLARGTRRLDRRLVGVRPLRARRRSGGRASLGVSQRSLAGLLVAGRSRPAPGSLRGDDRERRGGRRRTNDRKLAGVRRRHEPRPDRARRLESPRRPVARVRAVGRRESDDGRRTGGRQDPARRRWSPRSWSSPRASSSRRFSRTCRRRRSPRS